MAEGSVTGPLLVAYMLVGLSFAYDPLRRVLDDAGRYQALLDWAAEPDWNVRFRHMAAGFAQETFVFVLALAPMLALMIDWSVGGAILVKDTRLSVEPSMWRAEVCIAVICLLLAPRLFIHFNPGGWWARLLAKHSTPSIPQHVGHKDAFKYLLKLVFSGWRISGATFIAVIVLAILWDYFDLSINLTEWFGDFDRNEVLRIAQLAVLGVVIVMFLVLVVRPLLFKAWMWIQPMSTGTAVVAAVGVSLAISFFVLTPIALHAAVPDLGAFTFAVCMCLGLLVSLLARTGLIVSTHVIRFGPNAPPKTISTRVLITLMVSAIGFALAVAGITAAARGGYRFISWMEETDISASLNHGIASVTATLFSLDEADTADLLASSAEPALTSGLDATAYLARTAEAPWIGGAMATGAAVAMLLPGVLVLAATGMTLLAPGFARRAGPVPASMRGRFWHALRAFGLPVALSAVLIFWCGGVLFHVAGIVLATPGGPMQSFALWGARLVGG